MLTQDHISFIIRDLNRRGIILEGFQDEVIDHVCSAVEKEMSRGRNFREAYEEVVSAFGDSSGLHQTQDQVIKAQNPNIMSMFRNYFIVGVRNHLRQRFYTFINIGGLAVSVASCLIIALYVGFELSYDRQYPDAHRIFRVDQELKFGANHIIVAQAPASLAELLMADYPEVEASARLSSWGSRYFKLPGGVETFKEDNVVWADSSFFTMFPQKFIEGDAKTALREPNTLAVSRSFAEKYYPARSAVGQSVVFNQTENYMITAVYEDMPQNTHLHFDMLLSTGALEHARDRSLLGGGDMTTYIRLAETVSATEFSQKLDAFVDKHVAPQFIELMGKDFTMQKFRDEGQIWEYSLVPVSDIHLHSDKLGELGANGSVEYVYLFSAIGFFILAIACINFMNLSTARSSMRAKEVGVRKVMGSLRSHLVKQFLIESITLCLAAIALSVVVAVLILPYFNDLAQKQISIPFDQPLFYAIMLGAVLVIGALAGIYPSFFLSAFKPISVIKGVGLPGMKSSGIRSTLVVFQFVISILLIIGTIAVNLQIRFIRERSLGFQKDQVIVVHEAWSLGSGVLDFKKEALQHTAIATGTISGYLPVDGFWRNNDTMWQEGKEVSADNLKEMVSVQTWDVDHDYLETLGMKLIQGRDFSGELASDSTAVILNQAAVRKFGYPDPVGRKIHDFGAPNSDGTPNLRSIRTWTIIGVVEDFHFSSMKEAIKPVVLFLQPSRGSISFKYDAARTSEVIAFLETRWKERVSDRPFQYSFLDDDFARTYSSEERLSKIFGSFAILAIIIACLGLFALTAYTAEQRTKEIGIRKVLGASVNSIVVLLSKDFGKLVVIAFVLSVPLAWMGIKWWIESYEYRTDIGAWVYGLAGLAAFVIAILTMGFQSVKAAMSDPARILRNE